jgi:acetolactate synthase regulatory subunit
MSNTASRAPQEIRIDLAVLPETNCQGLFNQIHKTYKKFPEV